MSQVKLCRVRALRHLKVGDNDGTIHMVPKGMTGTLVGCAALANYDDKKPDPRFAVEWDVHAIGPDDKSVFGARHDPERDERFEVCEPGFHCAVDPKDVEFVGFEGREDPLPPAATPATYRSKAYDPLREPKPEPEQAVWVATANGLLDPAFPESGNPVVGVYSGEPTAVEGVTVERHLVKQPVLHPSRGGCWYCYRAGAELFSTEFDTKVHEACLRKAAENPHDPEAAAMARELLPPPDERDDD